MWLAHALTLSRLPIAVALIFAYGRPAWAAMLVGLAALTDMLDGRVARWAQRHGKSGPDIGGWLDPIVDKIFVVIVLATIWLHTRDVLLVGLIAAREIVMAPLFVVSMLRGLHVERLHARSLGKAATVAQFIACAIAVIDPTRAQLVAVVAGLLGLSAVFDYIAVARRDLSPTASGRFPRRTQISRSIRAPRA